MIWDGTAGEIGDRGRGLGGFDQSCSLKAWSHQIYGDWVVALLAYIA